ncbi:predicted protein [Postia placenta Mad-698-R]|uniref:Uncharacterized protein n=1 Tax=Postia placenta MAD-698-R-SB12 TaxID=670580 RepID=A0A1X6MWS8_9APHY|nr:hypothetical protein POSPLADRAFT_1146800 [Postia placenta MAD-698-R-SB12]EED85011.1 predicted protein [Postia placenta Mad-698-R]OSX60817.1 hypothetical protein POSPLADRAFT_1146800 [Postia placenta MAD-698-R-SB12]
MDGSLTRTIVSIDYDEYKWTSRAQRLPIKAPQPALPPGNFRTIIEGVWELEQCSGATHTRQMTDYPRLEALPPYKSAELDDWNHVVSLQLSGEIWRLTAQLHNLKPYSYDRGGHFDQGHRGCQRANVHSDNWENPNQSYHQNDGYMQIVQPDLGEVTVWDQQAPVPLVGWHPLPRGEGWYLCVQSQHTCEQRWPASIRKVPEQTERCPEQPECQAGRHSATPRCTASWDFGWHPLPGGGQYWGPRDRDHGLLDKHEPGFPVPSRKNYNISKDKPQSTFGSAEERMNTVRAPRNDPPLMPQPRAAQRTTTHRCAEVLKERG